MKPEDPKRYDFQGAVSEQGHLYARAIVKQSGKWVKYEDYEDLRADLSLALANQYATEKLTYQLEAELDELKSTDQQDGSELIPRYLIRYWIKKCAGLEAELKQAKQYNSELAMMLNPMLYKVWLCSKSKNEGEQS